MKMYATYRTHLRTFHNLNIYIIQDMYVIKILSHTSTNE
jgi:hypothetical protein